MKKLKFSILLLLLILFLTCNGKKNNKNFLYRDRNKIKLNGEEFKIQGVCFGNNVWENDYDIFMEVPTEHHTELDYKRVSEWGMNTVRFYMNYKTFESDENPFEYKQSGWDWLDKNIAWAKKYKVYLILNMMVSQGGQQSIATGKTLWVDDFTQKRFIMLWKEIAKRYKDEPVIAGYDILNEPVVEKGVSDWKNLAEKTVKEIRKVDNNHLIIIEPVLGIGQQWGTYHRIQNFFLVNDDNVLYSFHFYHPHDYTHQYAIWSYFKDKEGGKYPDEKVKINLSEKTIGINGEVRDKEYLQNKIRKYIVYGNKNNIPMYCGEFGVIRFCYENDKKGINRGGINWTGYMLDILMDNNIHFTYHSYHEKWFGIFKNREGLPEDKYANKELIKLFIKKLK